MFYETFFSPQVKPRVVYTSSLTSCRLRNLRKLEKVTKSQNFIEL